MSWLFKFFASSIGSKIIMSLTGLFLILFLIIHLVGNLQLLYSDGGEAFNIYAYFMTHNPVIKFISFGLYFFILLHAIQGILLSIHNRKARGSKYAVNTYENSTWASKNMALLGVLIFAFLMLHMGDFWYKMKFTSEIKEISYAGLDYTVKDMYARVYVAFGEMWIVLAYLVGMIAMAIHLAHGFTAAFQTLGIRHKKYTPIINFMCRMYTIIIPLGFSIIPIYIYFNR